MTTKGPRSAGPDDTKPDGSYRIGRSVVGQLCQRASACASMCFLGVDKTGAPLTCSRSWGREVKPESEHTQAAETPSHCIRIGRNWLEKMGPGDWPSTVHMLDLSDRRGQEPRIGSIDAGDEAGATRAVGEALFSGGELWQLEIVPADAKGNGNHHIAANVLPHILPLI